MNEPSQQFVDAAIVLIVKAGTEARNELLHLIATAISDITLHGAERALAAAEMVADAMLARAVYNAPPAGSA